MKMLFKFELCCIGSACALAIGCSGKPVTEHSQHPTSIPAVAYFEVDPAMTGSVTGTIRFVGKKTAPKLIDMSEDPACVAAHHGKAYDEGLLVGANGSLGNAFIYVKSGLEGKTFEPPSTPVTIDQSGCWFRPRILGIQTNQTLQIINPDPVTHNIHPMAEINREWNHSQGPGDPPLNRKFLKPEVMISVKCNIHSWMHAFIGVVDSPYYAVSKRDGTFEINNLPSGKYTIEVWQEKLGKQEQQVSIAAHQVTRTNITFKGH